MSRSRVIRAEPCAITAIPPTTTKSTPCAVSFRRSDSSRSSGHCATGPSGRQGELADTGVAGLKRAQPLARGQAQVLIDERLVDVGVRFAHRERELPAARAQRAFQRRHARARAVGLQARDGRLGGAHPARQSLLAEAGGAAGLTYELPRSHRKYTISSAKD